MTNRLHATLVTLETELHGSARGESGRLEDMLHPDFVEVGRSGNRYTKSQVVQALLTAPPRRVVAEELEVRELQPGVAIVTYRSTELHEDGSRNRATWRTSIWQLSDGEWRIRFHQGTPISEV